jgi:hypothetical protein
MAGTTRRVWPDEYFNSESENYGVRCPSCNCPRTKVDYTRHKIGQKNMRRRTCLNCGREFPTWETA